MLIKQLLLDKRVVGRALQNGLLNAAEYAKAIDALPDMSDNVARAISTQPVAAPAPEPEPNVSANVSDSQLTE